MLSFVFLSIVSLSVNMPNAVILSVVLLSNIMPSGITPGVVMLNGIMLTMSMVVILTFHMLNIVFLRNYI
jgi:hypothetical protein